MCRARSDASRRTWSAGSDGIMKQSIVHVALVVRDYDEAIQFYTEKLNFTLVEDTYQPEQDKRWVLVAPPGSNGVQLLLARASTPEQQREAMTGRCEHPAQNHFRTYCQRDERRTGTAGDHA